MTTPRIEQVTLPVIPWTTIESAIQVAFGQDAANWQIAVVEAEADMPQHLTVTPATANPNAMGKVKPTFLVFANHIPQPSGSPRLVLYIWAPRKGLGNGQVVDVGHSLIATVSHFCDVAAAIALRWRQMEVDQRLKVAFDEPEPDFDGYDIGDSAFDGGTPAIEPSNGEGSNFTDYTF